MKSLLVIFLFVVGLLFFPSESFGASVWCDPDRVIADDPSECPDIPSNIHVSFADHDSITASWSGVSNAGNAYLWVQAGTSLVPPRCDSQSTLDDRRVCNARVNTGPITAGTGASDAGSAVGTSGTLTVDTSIAAATNYCAVFMFVDDSVGGTHSEPTVFCGTTGAAPSSGTELASDTLRIRNGGSNLADCITHTTACQTTAVITGMSTGQDVAFLTGQTFTGQIDGWAGSSENWSQVLTYKHDSGTDYVIDLDEAEAILDGGVPRASFAAGTVDYSTAAHNADPVVPGVYNGLIYIGPGDNYFRVQSLKLENVRASGLYAVGTNGAAGSLQYVDINDVHTSHTGNSPIVLGNGLKKAVLRNSTMEYGSNCEDQRIGGGSGDTEECDYPGWPGGGVVVRPADSTTPAEILIYNTTIDRTFSEGFNCYDRANYVIFHKVKAARMWSNAAYPDGSNYCVYEHFMITGTHGSVGYSATSSDFGGALHTGLEVVASANAPSANNNVYRNGILVDTGEAIVMGIQGHVAGKTLGFNLYGVTIVDAHSEVYRDWGTYDSEVDVIDVRSNYIYSPNTSGSICQKSATKPTLDYNGWMGSTPAANCQGANDIINGTQDLPLTLAQYDDIDTTAEMDYTDFRLQSSSAGYDDGDPSLESEVLFDAAELANFGYALDKLIEYEPHITAANWGKKLFYCYEGTDRPADTPPMGAVCEAR